MKKVATPFIPSTSAIGQANKAVSDALTTAIAQGDKTVSDALTAKVTALDTNQASAIGYLCGSCGGQLYACRGDEVWGRWAACGEF